MDSDGFGWCLDGFSRTHKISTQGVQAGEYDAVSCGLLELRKLHVP